MHLKSLTRRQAMTGTAAVSSAYLFSTMLPAFAADANPLLKMSAQQAVSAIQSGSVTAVAYLNALLGQTKRHASLKALIYLNEAAAMRAAEKIDADRIAGRKLRRWPACSSSPRTTSTLMTCPPPQARLH